MPISQNIVGSILLPLSTLCESGLRGRLCFQTCPVSVINLVTIRKLVGLNPCAPSVSANWQQLHCLISRSGCQSEWFTCCRCCVNTNDFPTICSTLAISDAATSEMLLL